MNATAEFITSHRIGMLIVLVIGSWLVLRSMLAASRETSNTFDLLDLLMDDGRASRSGIVFMVAFAFSVWLMVDLEIHNKMDIAYFAAFNATWVAPIMARIIMGSVTTHPPPATGEEK